MLLVNQIKKVFDFLFHANVIKTIIFNFRMLPLKQAVRLPIWLFGRIDIGKRMECGKIFFSSQTPLHFGGWQIGLNIDFLAGINTHPNQTVFVISGILVLGEHGRFANGTLTHVKQNAILSIGDNFLINYSSKIACYEKISIGSHCRISWESQIFDTDFHYISDETGNIRRNKEPIYIGNEVWVGNRVTISKGAHLCDKSIVASNSLVNKNFESLSGVYAGCPAKLVAANKYRILDCSTESMLDEIFSRSTLLAYNLNMLNNDL